MFFRSYKSKQTKPRCLFTFGKLGLGLGVLDEAEKCQNKSLKSNQKIA